MFVLSAVEFGKLVGGSWTAIDQITDWRISPNLAPLIVSGGSKIDPKFIANIDQAPAISFSTTAMKVAMDKVGLDGLELDSGDTPEQDAAILWFRRRAHGGKWASGNTAIKVTINMGLVYMQPTEARLGQPATIGYAIQSVYDGSNDPIVVEKETAYSLNGTPATEAYWTVGKGYVNGQVLERIQSFRFDPQIELRLAREAGAIWPIEAALKSRKPFWEWETENLQVFDSADGGADLALGVGGIKINTGSGVTRAFLQKVDEGGKLVGETVAGGGEAVHIEFEVFEGTVGPGDVAGSHQQDGTMPVRVTPSDDDSNAVVVIDTADEIATT